jgi:hypothetical protein
VHLSEPVGRIRLEVDATMQAGSALDGYGLRCIAGGTAYNARITAAGRYAITTVKDSSESILPGVGSAGPFIDDARSRTALGFDCIGTRDRVRLRLWANRKLLTSADDPLPGAAFTSVGFFTSSDSGETDVRFDNFAAGS